jgi:hypothetical protein
MLSIFANSRCNMIDYSLPDQDGGGFFGEPLTPRSFGLWCYEAQNGNKYDTRDTELDSKFEAARGLGTTVMVLGWLIFCFYLIASCKRFPPKAFMMIGFLCVCTSFFQGLVFLVNKSEVCEIGSCSLGTGGRCGISAIVFWFLAGATSCASGKEAEDARQDDEPEAVQQDKQEDDTEAVQQDKQDKQEDEE